MKARTPPNTHQDAADPLAKHKALCEALRAQYEATNSKDTRGLPPVFGFNPEDHCTADVYFLPACKDDTFTPVTPGVAFEALSIQPSS
jgi:hypothetical protein